MNKKQLAKLLIKHPEIKALYESRSFDASIINKVIAEEIVKEQDDEEGEGRVSKADKQARAELDAEDSVFNLDPSLSDAEIRKQFRAALKSAATLEQIGALGKEASEILDPKYARTLEKDIKAAKARIEGGSTNDSKEDPVKKELIQSMKSEIEFLKSLLNDPKTMPLDKEEYKEAIGEYTKKLEQMGVAVASTPSAEDDKAFVQSIQDKKPEIEKAADAVKAAGDDEFAEKFSDLDAAIMAALKGSKDAATAANDDLDLPDIEIEDDADGSTDGLVDGLNQESTEANREKIRKNVDRAINAISRFFTISDYPNDLRTFLDQEDVKAGGRNGDLIAVNIDQKSSKAILLCYLISRVAGGSDGNAIESFAKNGFPIMSPSPLGLTPAKYSEALSKLGLTTIEAKEIFRDAQRPLNSALNALMESNKRGEKTKFKNEQQVKQVVMLPFVRKFINDSSISEIITSATSEPTQQGVTTPEPQSTEEPSPQPPTKRGIKIAQGAIRGQDVNTSEVSPEEVKAAIEQDKEQISADPEMRDNAEELVQQVQAKTGDETTITSEQPATEEGTAAAVEAIKNEVPVEVEDIEPADVQAAEEELKSEIEEDPQKEARAEELTKKVEKKKMSDKSKAVSSWANFKNNLKQSNVDNKGEVLKTEVEKRLKIYSTAQSWGDLAKDPLNHEISKEATEASFEKWKSDSLPEIEKYFNGVLERTVDEPEEIDSLAVDIESQIGTIDDAMNNVADESDISGDSSGADVTGATDLETIKKILPELKDQFPNLFKFDEFVKNLAQALMKAEPSSDSDGEEGEQIDAAGTASSSGTNLDSNIDSGSSDSNLQESLSGIYLTEETEADVTKVDNAADDTIGQPVSVEDATALKTELEELRKILEPKKINIEDLLPQDLKDALAKAPETDVEAEPKTAEQGAEDGNTASETDAQLEQASAIEIYSALIQPMDDFFSTDQAQRLGFMEQFLLESQSKMLWNLIGNLTLIAEKGKAKAFTNRAEKEEAGMSGEGAPEAEVEPTAEPEVQAEAIGDFFKRDKEPVEISKEDQISLKTDLKALLQTLRATKSMIGSYERNMTKVSVDPGLDGSALKEQLDQYLPMVQKSIAKIVERANEAFIKATELNAPKEEPEVTPPADTSGSTPPTEPEVTQEGMINAIFEAMQPALHEMSLMQEESRDETINRVDSVYKDMRLIYAPVGGGEDSEGLRGFMETGDRARTIQQAEKMLELATKEDFIKLFPGGRIGEGGMPATVNAATETMNREIKKLVLIMRDVVTLASKSVIPHSKLTEIVNSLTTISKSLYNSFGAKMMISGESLAQIETRLGEDESNKSLTDQETKPGMMDKLGDLAGKGLEKLKQMFGWMSEETRKLLLKFFGEENELIDGLSNSDLSEEQQQVFTEEIIDSKSWYEALEQDAKSAVDALVKYLINAVGRDSLKKLNYPAVVSEKLNDEERISISKFAQNTQATFGKELSNLTYRFLHGADEEIKASSMKIMINQTDDLVSYLTTIFKIVDKISDEAAEEMVSAPNDPNPGMTGPSDTKAKADSNPEEEAEEEKDDATDITALKTPITNQWAQFGNEWLKLSDKARTIIPDLAGELALEFIEEGAESLSPKPSPEVEQDLEEVLGFSMKEKVAKTISEVEKELRSTKNERFSGKSPWAFYSGPSSEAGADDEYKGVRGKRSKSIAINTSMSILNANKDKIEKMLKVSKKKKIIELLKQMALTKGVPALLGNANINFQNNLLSNPFMKQYRDSIEFQDFSASLEPDTEENRQLEGLEKALRPIIEKMLNEHYNH